MDRSRFVNLATNEVNAILKLFERRTVTFTYDGTRRWFLSEIAKIRSDGRKLTTNPLESDWSEYCKESVKKFVELVVMMFNHGIYCVTYPAWVQSFEKRGSSYLSRYMQYLESFRIIEESAELIDIINKSGVRIVFYGDYESLLKKGKRDDLIILFKRLTYITQKNTRHILLIGFQTENPTLTISKLSIDHFKDKNTSPTREELILRYFGVPVPDVKIYIGFDKTTVEGSPILISEGNEDLYWTVSPHGYLNEIQFREILYDHFFCRNVTNAKMYNLNLKDICLMRNFYRKNRFSTLGVGNVMSNGWYWYPLPQVHSSRADFEDGCTIEYDPNSVNIPSFSPKEDSTDNMVKSAARKLKEQEDQTKEAANSLKQKVGKMKKKEGTPKGIETDNLILSEKRESKTNPLGKAIQKLHKSNWVFGSH